MTEFAGALKEWAPAGWRELPWRATRDPWAILVSELMLQQTQVARVVDPWTRFLAQWPTASACAAAPAADVVRAWAGLGYNRRALNLHRCATLVTERHGGRLPEDLTSLLALPGVGPYTARAVLAFALERDVAVLDTNVSRVMARAVTGRRLTRSEAQQHADALVPQGHGWRWNQTLLDFGATVCTARAPKCGACPVADICAWQGTGPDPATPATRQSPFAGSDRQGRGRLLAALRTGPVRDVAAACGWPDDEARAARIAAQLVAEGFATERAEGLELSLR